MYGLDRKDDKSKWKYYRKEPDIRVNSGLKEIANKSTVLASLIEKWKLFNKESSKQPDNDELKITEIRWRNPRF